MTGPAVKRWFLAEPELSISVFIADYSSTGILSRSGRMYVVTFGNMASKMAAMTRDILFHFNVVTRQLRY